MKIIMREPIPILSGILHKISPKLYRKFGCRTIKRNIIQIEDNTITVDKPFPGARGNYIIENHKGGKKWNKESSLITLVEWL